MLEQGERSYTVFIFFLSAGDGGEKERGQDKEKGKYKKDHIHGNGKNPLSMFFIMSGVMPFFIESVTTGVRAIKRWGRSGGG